ncbi:hypothetical protein ERO13_D02G037300v2 [Gossypium hirsutum]|uniref:Uncharacterized GPI-anchored protein At3g06035 n=4 Tax=Gossypium TaxID=3633 RepID=A0A1U8LM23_GOSHI|nr:uncharacterized GPI-anchored protein At3g06035 [Gossypium raimondii]XP_016714234.1 uncharacterized GPI-anchored protein At3g06035 [Gossypium hirsutum]KAG4157043.1 hypothetical protein ERO13_D02G037300v2 [Gossypium hirsutum]KJB28305.1 hypothetical protein B456_005G041200 [Gossypium raimondii]TYH82306.1 hypothetical protein ES332_D02G051200v1 [Gossypium tomentosum]
MAFSKISLFFPVLLSILFIISPVFCDNDEEDDLLKGINSYRASLNLTSLTTNENAECLADELAEEFKNQPCTNSTGANTVPGTEPQFANYPNLLAKCHLNVSVTRDGAVMPACVPNLAPSLVLTNFTQSQYSGNLNETKYTGIGIGSEGDWIVVVLTTSTTEGNYATATTAATTSAANSVSKITIIHHLLLLLMAAFYML